MSSAAAVVLILAASSASLSSSGFRVHWPASFDPTRRSMSTSISGSIAGPPFPPLPPLPFPEPYENTNTCNVGIFKARKNESRG